MIFKSIQISQSIELYFIYCKISWVGSTAIEYTSSLNIFKFRLCHPSLAIVAYYKSDRDSACILG